MKNKEPLKKNTLFITKRQTTNKIETHTIGQVRGHVDGLMIYREAHRITALSQLFPTKENIKFLKGLNLYPDKHFMYWDHLITSMVF